MALESDIPINTWFIGAPLNLAYTIYQADGVTPQNVTGWTFEWSLRRYDAAPDPALISKTVGAGITVTTAASGIVTVALTAADSDPLREGLYRTALKRTNSGAEAVLSFGVAPLQQVATH